MTNDDPAPAGATTIGEPLDTSAAPGAGEPVPAAAEAPSATSSGIHGGLAATAEPDAFKKPLMVTIRRKRPTHHAASHGGAWKIAYADFVTAMMAFFLLMWLLTSTNHGDLEGIADYFNRPLNALLTQGPGTAPITAKTDTNTQDKKQKDDADQLSALKAKLEELIERDAKLKAFKNQIKIDSTPEGLRVQIIDAKNRPMFDKGDAVLKNYTRDILDRIGVTLNDVPNHITITGHTDALAYSGSQTGYSNWELSSDRANAARRELLTGGMSAGKILQVRGLADALPLFKNEPTNPSNRRISIVVLNKDAEARFLDDGRAKAPAPASGDASPAPAEGEH